MTGRILRYDEALREGIAQEMRLDPSVVVFGLDVDDWRGIYGTTKDLHEEFGRDRCFHTPLSEDAMTGAAVGMALAGLRPVHVHIRMDFLLLGMNQLVNIAAKARYMYGGAVSVPIVIRSIIGRSWGQGAHHSQGLHSFFMHVPGVKVVAPTTAFDAKGALIASIRDDDPVMFVEHRMIHGQRGHVPEEPYEVPLGRCRVLLEGADLTIVGISHFALEATRAAYLLREVGISAEVIDPVWLQPLDVDGIAASVRKTGKLLVVDTAWTSCGATAEILARVVEALQGEVELRVARMGFAPVTCPTVRCLEDEFYPNSQKIAARAFELVRGEATWSPAAREVPEVDEFKGPF